MKLNVTHLYREGAINGPEMVHQEVLRAYVD